MPCGNLTRKHFDAKPLQLLRVPLRRPLAGVVPVVSQIHPPRLVLAECLQQLLGKTFRAVNARHVFEAVHPKRQRVNHRFAQDDFRLRPGTRG